MIQSNPSTISTTYIYLSSSIIGIFESRKLENCLSPNVTRFLLLTDDQRVPVTQKIIRQIEGLNEILFLVDLFPAPCCVFLECCVIDTFPKGNIGLLFLELLGHAKPPLHIFPIVIKHFLVLTHYQIPSVSNRRLPVQW